MLRVLFKTRYSYKFYIKMLNALAPHIRELLFDYDVIEDPRIIWEALEVFVLFF
jgi:hypothetical protein